jgi:ring-1,2-phenylacetyl-CoA epoxidase subunit PaaE
LKPVFYTISVAAVRPETNDAVCIELSIPDALKPIFAYRAGQYITLKANINGSEVRRTYSLCSSPLEGTWQVGIKKVPGGLFSNWACNSLKAGDTLEAMPPMGRFCIELQPQCPKLYVAFVAGSGITPVLSLLKTILAAEPLSRFTLVYGNKSRSSIMFRETLEALKNKYLHRLQIHYIFSREKTDADINYGRIDADKCNLLLQKLVGAQPVSDYFLCGPQAMIEAVQQCLLANNVPEYKVHFELFTTGSATKTFTAKASPANENNSHITIRLDGVETGFYLAADSYPILDAALLEGLDLPYACKGGMCCTCKAKLLKGQVSMEVHYGLESDEIAAGYILTCQAHPLTPEVVVDFDDR